MDLLELKQRIIKESSALEPYIIDCRRRIHMYPETAYEEHKTAQLIENELEKIGYITKRTAKTGIIGTIDGINDKKTIALRADIDGLNITEELDVPYLSRNIGKMHACGHDAHIAMLLGAANILFKYKRYLKNNLKLVFQPAEEGGGGGKKIVEEGHFNDVYAVFGIHVWQELPSGVISTRKGAMFASSDRFTITIKGKGGHVAMPYLTIDPTAVLTDIYNALQKVISREIDPFEPRILAIPMISGSDAHNIIPTVATLRGTLRTLNPSIREYIIQRIREIVDGYCKAWKCEGLVEFDPLAYPPLINDDEVVENIKIILKELDTVKDMEPSMVGEDFSFYLKKTKGAFLTLGIRNEGAGTIFPHHHPKFQVDETVLWKGTAVYALLGFYSLFIEI